MRTLPSRRSFFGTAAAGAAALNAVPSHAQRRNRPSVELMKIGVIAVGEYSHMNSQGAGIWAPVINPVDTDRWPTRNTDMLITHCWDSRPDRAAEFATRYDCEAVKNYDDMIGQVDGLITAGLYECKWWPKLVRPYLEAGIPTFINRPFAVSMKDAKEMVDTAKRYNAPIMCSDAHEDLKEALIAKARVAALLKEKRAILGANATTGAHEYPAHLLHSLYEVLTVFGHDVNQVSLQAPSWWQNETPTNPNGRMEWGIMTLQYNGITIEGAAAQTKPFLVTAHALDGYYDSRGTLRIYYQNGWEDFDQRILPGDFFNDRYHLQAKTVFSIQKMFRTKKMPQSYEDILEKTKIFLAGFKSHIDHDGRMVKVADVPDSWEAPSPYPDWIDESIFG